MRLFSISTTGKPKPSTDLEQGDLAKTKAPDCDSDDGGPMATAEEIQDWKDNVYCLAWLGFLALIVISILSFGIFSAGWGDFSGNCKTEVCPKGFTKAEGCCFAVDPDSVNYRDGNLRCFIKGGSGKPDRCTPGNPFVKTGLSPSMDYSTLTGINASELWIGSAYYPPRNTSRPCPKWVLGQGRAYSKCSIRRPVLCSTAPLLTNK